jgi:hypothetical protein
MLKEMKTNHSGIKDTMRNITSGIWYLPAPKRPPKEGLTIWLQDLYKG